MGPLSGSERRSETSVIVLPSCSRGRSGVARSAGGSLEGEGEGLEEGEEVEAALEDNDDEEASLEVEAAAAVAAVAP